MRPLPNLLNQSGLTLTELLITVSIAGILLAIGVPSYQEFITSSAASGYASDLIADFNYARSEAITRGQRVVVCKGPTATNCTTGNWEDGWKVFVDCDGDSVQDTIAANTTCDEESVLRVHSALGRGWTARSTPGTALNNRITYLPTGLSAGVLGTLRICRDGGENGNVHSTRGRAIVVNMTGRVRLATDSNDDQILDNDDGALECKP